MLNLNKKTDENLKKRVIKLEKKVEELEMLLLAVKQVAGETKKRNDIARKNKWLNGYPDESKE